MPTYPISRNRPGDLARLPVVETCSPEIETLVDSVVSINQSQGRFNESTSSFVQPLPWLAYEKLLASCGHELSETEEAINDSIFRLFGVEECDRVAIEEELAALNSSELEDDDASEPVDAEELSSTDEGATGESFSRQMIAADWLSCAVGIVLGRFHPGIENALGRGDFSPEVSEQLRTLADSDGVMVLDVSENDN